MSLVSDIHQFIKGKTVTLMGLGLLGRGVGDAKFLAPLVKHLIITDMKTDTQLAPSLKKLKKFKNITYRLGEHQMADFTRTDLVIYSAGVPFNSPFLECARERNIPTTMSTALCVKIAQEKGVRIIGITGTRGKSTVTHLLYNILQKERLGLLSKRSRSKKNNKVGGVYLGGNVLGLSTLALLKKLIPGDILVLELDSWQLQGFGLEKISPDVAVFTTFMPDHQNYYAQNMERYFADKSNIYLHQKTGILVCGPQMKKQLEIFAPQLDRKIVFAPTKTKGISHRLLGSHNDTNVSIAYTVAKFLGVAKKTIASVCKNFEGVPGRLQIINDNKKIIWINDTTATTPEATYAGVLAVNKYLKLPLVLIAGGANKELSPEAFLEACALANKLILFSGTGTEKILKNCNGINDIPCKKICLAPLAGSMQEAVALAYQSALDLLSLSRNKKVAILLSPGFASFGMFLNEFDRGDRFVREIKKYSKNRF